MYPGVFNRRSRRIDGRTEQPLAEIHDDPEEAEEVQKERAADRSSTRSGISKDKGTGLEATIVTEMSH